MTLCIKTTITSSLCTLSWQLNGVDETSNLKCIFGLTYNPQCSESVTYTITAMLLMQPQQTKRCWSVQRPSATFGVIPGYGYKIGNWPLSLCAFICSYSVTVEARRNGNTIARRTIDFTIRFDREELEQLLALAKRHMEPTLSPFEVRLKPRIWAKESEEKRRFSIASNHANISMRYRRRITTIWRPVRATTTDIRDRP